ncbi:restriction endonuclease subunit S [Antribacter sp. KLBMP9083]|uniref:Restriction endonuclease subunit S n=1 Tax=Antribacter soli TaxID=2910976 RepID=A0AA41QH33_9MICO|nr:restriction endonuclease subunit S [Antribacter soli]MCF4123022.1 restriction endonuclease subunit S [Antribacter soli]
MHEARLTPIKFIGKIVSGGTPTADAANWGGEVPFITPPDLNGVDGGVVPHWDRSLTERGTAGSAVVENAALLSCRAPIGHVGIVRGAAAFNQGCKAILPEHPEDLRYLGHVLVAQRGALQAAGRGTTFLELSTTELASFGVPWPEPAARAHIADYLDRETSEIDAMIGKLDELAARIRERRGSVWSSTYARGFEQKRLQWFVDEIDERAGGVLADLPMLSVSIHHGIQRREDSSSKQRAGEDLTKYKVARAGDIVINRMRAFQGGLGRTSVDGLVSPDYAVLRPTNGFNAQWGEYVMRSPRFVSEMSQRLRGIGGADQSSVRTPRINVRDLLLIMIPVADPDALRVATDHLDEVTGRIDQMLAKVADLKKLLLERRAALITDVVTGRKDIA